jgi:hypothetical protein
LGKGWQSGWGGAKVSGVSYSTRGGLKEVFEEAIVAALGESEQGRERMRGRQPAFMRGVKEEREG